MTRRPLHNKHSRIPNRKSQKFTQTARSKSLFKAKVVSKIMKEGVKIKKPLPKKIEAKSPKTGPEDFASFLSEIGDMDQIYFAHAANSGLIFRVGLRDYPSTPEIQLVVSVSCINCLSIGADIVLNPLWANPDILLYAFYNVDLRGNESCGLQEVSRITVYESGIRRAVSYFNRAQIFRSIVATPLTLEQKKTFPKRFPYWLFPEIARRLNRMNP